ncbi:hypothetical protein BJX70DRAFT_379010 [Aspergillus crustosus]
MPTIPPYEVAETIRRSKSLYLRAADTKQWDLFSTILHPSLTASLHKPDGSLDSFNGREFRFSSREDYVSVLRKRYADIRFIHVGGPGELEMISEDEVAAVWAMSYSLGTPEENAGEFTEVGGGYYHEVWKKLDGKWVIASLKFLSTFRRAL